MLSETSQSLKDSVWFHLCEALRVLKTTEKQRGVMGARSWGKGRMASNCLLAIGFSFTRQKQLWRWKLVAGAEQDEYSPPLYSVVTGLPWWLRWQRICLQRRRSGFSSRVGKIPWRREWLLTLMLLPGEFHGQRSLAGYSRGGLEEPDTAEWLLQLRFWW